MYYISPLTVINLTVNNGWGNVHQISPDIFNVWSVLSYKAMLYEHVCAVTNKWTAVYILVNAVMLVFS